MSLKTVASLKAKFRAQAKRLGVTVDWDNWDMEAGDHKRFAATGTHYVVFEPWSITRPDGVVMVGKAQLAEAYEHALSDLSYGLEDCPPDCECRDEIA